MEPFCPETSLSVYHSEMFMFWMPWYGWQPRNQAVISLASLYCHTQELTGSKFSQTPMLFPVVPRLLWRRASGNFTTPDDFTTLQKPVTKSNRTKMSCIILIAYSLLRYQKRNVSYCLSTHNAHFTSELICKRPYLLQVFWGLRTCQQFLMVFCMK